ncbi:hypothetical protein LX03_02770 [Limosilactobacillus mucosae]|jgi:hypothetical protein|uniref:Uncharacterized protein n=1 Tax=Limosilactobacillus mucosae TaxID=97478 RepID=A0A099YF83_LIMMU|nr:hypothetical protein LX03_02770 [Limosilactobacillus mucosae]
MVRHDRHLFNNKKVLLSIIYHCFKPFVSILLVGKLLISFFKLPSDLQESQNHLKNGTIQINKAFSI